MKIIVGLGNYPKEYYNTKHNIGFMIVDNYLSDKNVSYKEKFNGLFVKLNIHNTDVIFLKPQTFMNLSGESLIKFIKYYDIEIDDILVIYDDIDLEFGKLKIKKKSSSGGHNGIKNIMDHLKSDLFLKLKFGIKSQYKIDTKKYVLSKFNSQEKELINLKYKEINNIIDDFIIDSDSLKLQNKYN